MPHDLAFHQIDHVLGDVGRAVGDALEVAGDGQQPQERLGALGLALSEPERRFDPEDLALAAELARRAALAVDNARLYEAALRARTEAEAARERIANILESITDGFIALDLDWQFTYVNREAEKLLERARADLLGRSIWAAFPRAVGSPLERECRRAVVERRPVEFESPSPVGEAWLEVRAYPSKDGLSIHFRDVTARRRVEEALRRSEEQLRQAQKMEAIGTLAGGIAHDFNNLLVGILGNAALAMLELPAGSPARPLLEEIQDAARRMADLSRQMLLFSGRSQVARQRVDLNEVVAAAVAAAGSRVTAGTAPRYGFSCASRPHMNSDQSTILAPFRFPVNDLLLVLCTYPA